MNRVFYIILICCLSLFVLCRFNGGENLSAQNWNYEFGDSLWVGTGIDPYVVVFESFDSLLYAAGAIEYAGTELIGGITSWDSTNWYSYGSGITIIGGGVLAIAKFNDNLIVGGRFHEAGNQDSTELIASWNGSSWNKVGDIGNPNNDVLCLEVYNNKLFVGGKFVQIGDEPFYDIACWDDTNWLHVGDANYYVYTLEVYNDELYAGGTFSSFDGIQTYNIARYDGVQWDSVGSGMNGYVGCLFTDTIENILYAGGWFTQAGGVTVSSIAAWDGTSWSAMGFGHTGEVKAITRYRGDIYIGGCFSQINGTEINYIARWENNMWNPLEADFGIGTNWYVLTLEVYKDELYVGGTFTAAGGIEAIGKARWFIPDSLVDVDSRRGYWITENTLGNNIPNPAKNTTIITYNLPAGKKATLDIHDIQGKLAGSYNLQEYSDSIEISLNGWNQGTYLYSLIIDGRKVQTKKMVVTK